MKKVRLVGILNVTPDSFSDGNLYSSLDAALEQAEKLFSEGADLLDVGGEATNPWAEPIDSKEEWKRISQIIKILLRSHPGKVSLDTRHPETAKKFLELGGSILNDVSGFQDKAMVSLAKAYGPICVVNHFPGKNPRVVHQQEIDSLKIVKNDLLRRKDLLVGSGIREANIVLDPGIGFGKTVGLNWKLLEFASQTDYPVMIGHSRKRFLGEHRFDIKPNLEAAKIAINSGAQFLRVHEIAPYKELLRHWSG